MTKKIRNHKKIDKPKRGSKKNIVKDNAILDRRSYELGLAHGHTRALYLIKLCLDGYKEASEDKEGLQKVYPKDDEVTLQGRMMGLEVHADAAEFILGYVSSVWDGPDELEKALPGMGASVKDEINPRRAFQD